MAHADDVEFLGHPAVGGWCRAMAVACLLLAGAAQAAEPDLAKA